jgi:hypothetical protein
VQKAPARGLHSRAQHADLLSVLTVVAGYHAEELGGVN